MLFLVCYLTHVQPTQRLCHVVSCLLFDARPTHTTVVPCCCFLFDGYCLLVDSRPSYLLVYNRGVSARTIVSAITLRSCRLNFRSHPAPDTGPTSPRTDPTSQCAWQRSHWSTSFKATGVTGPGKTSTAKPEIEPRSSALEKDVKPPN